MTDDKQSTGGKTDLSLLAISARGGDDAAADLLFVEARIRLIKITLAHGVPPEDASDLVHEVLMNAWRNLKVFDPELASFVGWLYPGLRGRIVNRNRATVRMHLFLKKLKGHVSWNQNQEPSAQESVEARLTLIKLMDCLTDRQRQVVALYDIEGLSARETARLLGISEAGLRSIARDAHRRLAERCREIEEEVTHED